MRTQISGSNVECYCNQSDRLTWQLTQLCYMLSMERCCQERGMGDVVTFRAASGCTKRVNIIHLYRLFDAHTAN